MLVNPAVANVGKLNVFTQHIKSFPGTSVKMRNGAVVVPIYHEAEDEFCTSSFMTADHNYCWELDGISVTNPQFDLVRIHG